MELIKVVGVLTFCAYVGAIVGPTNGTKSSVQKTDTYLDAYSKSRIEAEKAKQGVIIVTAKDGEKKITNRDDSFSGYDYPAPTYSSPDSFSSSGYSGPSSSSSNNYLPPTNSYSTPIKFSSETTYNQPANTYGPPANTYGPPSNTYGPPSNTYGPPSNTYGPPSNSYGPPAQTYGPPAQSYGPPIHRPLPPVPVYGPPINHGVPYHSSGLGFLDKFKLKLNILTIAKLLLKLLIFKKLVTMLAVVCMLLVIPKLIEFKKSDDSSGSNDEGYERNFGDNKEVRLTSAHQLFTRAVEVYGRQRADCGITCRIQRVIDDIYEFEPYVRNDAFSTPDVKES